MSEKCKFVTVKGQEYRIGKFSAMDGAFIIPKVTGMLAPILGPLLEGLDVKQFTKPEDLDLKNFDIIKAMAPLADLEEKDFMYLQDKCLKVVTVKRQAGYVPVIHDNGSFSVETLEDDGMSVLALMVHTLIFNFTGFFEGSPFTGLLSGLLGTAPQNS